MGQVKIFDLGDALHIFQHLGDKPLVGIELPLRKGLFSPLHGGVDGEEQHQSGKSNKPHTPVKEEHHRRDDAGGHLAQAIVIEPAHRQIPQMLRNLNPLVGAGAAGYDHYHWSPVLLEALAPFREQYGFTSPLAGFYHCFSSYGEQWGYYSQYIRFMWEAPTGQPYLELQALVADKPAFVLTTNVDQQFFRVFPQKQICAFQGDFSYCQCSQPCREDIGENRELVKELTGCLVGVRLPEEAVPRCPDCGRVLVPWVRDDGINDAPVLRQYVAGRVCGCGRDDYSRPQRYPGTVCEKSLKFRNKRKQKGDPSRMKVLFQIEPSEACVSEAADKLNMSESAVSHHIHILRMNGLVRWRRSGKAIYYVLKDDHVRSIIFQGYEHIKEFAS